MDDFERIILSYRDSVFNVIDPSRNYGDILIQRGMVKILKNAGISYRFYRSKLPNDIVSRILWTVMEFVENIFPKIGMPRDKCKKITKPIQSLIISYCAWRSRINFNKDEVILIQGGGDFNDMCGSYGLRLLKTILKHCPENILIVGPQSYYFEMTNFPKFFTNHKGKVYLFCREKFSYKLLQSMRFPENVKILLSRDMAFYAIEDILPLYKNAKVNSFSYDLLAFREDVESIINDEIKKLIKMKIGGTRRILESDISIRAKNLSEFFNLIVCSRRVYTDRLHIGMVAALLGKKVFLFPCCYWKTKGVYLYNLKNYNNVVFIDEHYLEKMDKLTDLLFVKGEKEV